MTNAKAILSLFILLILGGLVGFLFARSTSKCEVAGQAPTGAALNANTASSSWATFTNPEDFYTIQYPTNFGPVGVRYRAGTRGTLLDNASYEVEIDFLDDPQGLTLAQWLAKQEGSPPTDTISVGGLQGFLFPNPGPDGTVGAYLYRSPIQGGPYIYEISFGCPGYCEPPTFWRQMLASFRPLQAEL
jgi:hypothetical protein